MTVDAVTAALREVLDPEYPISIVDMGLIRGVEVDESTVRVRITYTSMGCPCMEMIQDDIRERLMRLSGVERVEIQVVWEPWSRQHITTEGWQRLGRVGVV
ncbi:MAG: metal-sulfur cluster assembly factor [Armatimonadota bacterium]